MNLTAWHIGMNVNAFVMINMYKYVYDIIYYIGGRDRVESEVIEGEYCCYLLYRRKGPGWSGGDQRGVLLLFIVSEEGPGWTGGDRMGVILLKYAWMYVCDIQYMDVVIYVIRFMDAVIYIIRYMGVANYGIRYMDVANYDIRYMDMIVYDIRIMDVVIYDT